MFFDITLNNETPIYLQIKDYIKGLILKGVLQKHTKLPSTRELSIILKVSRNTVISAYQYLEDEGFIYTIKGKGAFIADISIENQRQWNLKWDKRLSSKAKLAEELDIVKNEDKWMKGMISFKSISPDDSLFDVDEFKRAFLNRMSIEGKKLLNYGYAKGYKPLCDYLLGYMKNKGVDLENKDILITNGFTEGFDIILSSLTSEGDKVICENPTHNTAIKIMRLNGLETVGVEMDEGGINPSALKKCIKENQITLAYIIPSYHNPTGITMTPERRIEIYNIFRESNIPVIEDGFNEELRYSGTHVSPLISISGRGNGIIYTGSFSKVLFPGIRIGWIIGDKKLISVLESVKRSRNIHTSFLDQAILYEYLKGGNLDKYLKKARKYYREKYELAIKYAKEYIPCSEILGEGGLHIFVKLKALNSRVVLKECIRRGVIFTPGDIFYTDKSGQRSFRIGIARVSNEEIKTGIKIIGDVIRDLEGIN